MVQEIYYKRLTALIVITALLSHSFIFAETSEIKSYDFLVQLPPEKGKEVEEFQREEERRGKIKQEVASLRAQGHTIRTTGLILGWGIALGGTATSLAVGLSTKGQGDPKGALIVYGSVASLVIGYITGKLITNKGNSLIRQGDELERRSEQLPLEFQNRPNNDNQVVIGFSIQF